MSANKLIKMVVIPADKWSLIRSKGKGHLIKIGPFEEWVPQRVVEIAADGTLFLSSAFLKPGRLWTSVVKNYPTVKRQAAEVDYGGGGAKSTGKSTGTTELEIEFDYDDDDD